MRVFTFQRGSGGLLSGGVVVRADIGAGGVRVHIAVNGDDFHPRSRSVVDGGGVLFIVDGGKNQNLRAVRHRLRNHLILGGVVLLRLRSDDKQIQIIFGGGCLSTGENGFPEFRVGGFGHQSYPVLFGGSRTVGAAGQQCQRQRKGPQRDSFTLPHRRPP
ncbi:hypothetical protein SDC9_180040 [bioreactor metagenome]|uniref:Uncharacterized protein n=1 Tax=bioreactor metagenome TaxID=1076179 RepID=A0A645H0H9_9ZZZZ